MLFTSRYLSLYYISGQFRNNTMTYAALRTSSLERRRANDNKHDSAA